MFDNTANPTYIAKCLINPYVVALTMHGCRGMHIYLYDATHTQRYFKYLQTTLLPCLPVFTCTRVHVSTDKQGFFIQWLALIHRVFLCNGPKEIIHVYAIHLLPPSWSLLLNKACYKMVIWLTLPTSSIHVVYV